MKLRVMQDDTSKGDDETARDQLRASLGAFGFYPSPREPIPPERPATPRLADVSASAQAPRGQPRNGCPGVAEQPAL